MAISVDKFNKRLEALRSERSSFIHLYRELSDYHLSYRGRFLTSDRNKGFKRNTKQYNNTSRLSSRSLSSGMMSGITSPARPWFRLGTADVGLKEHAPVKEWLHKVQTIMYRVYAQSNTYNSLHTLYGELGVFGTSVMGVFDDFENVLRCQPYTVGSYMLGMDGKNHVDTMYREYEISVGQCVKQFGLENCSNTVQQQWKRGATEAWVPIVHVIEPNDDRDMVSPFAKDKPTRSVYYEKGKDTRNNNKYLRESGFDDFPVLAPRWDVTGEDVYGVDCPGMTTLGDTKALQLGERYKFQAIDLMVKPPLQGPADMQNKVGKSLRNGEIAWRTSTSGDGLKSIYDFRPDLNALMTINDQTEERIRRGFYEDLFLMLANDDRRQPVTAREIAEKHEEKLLMLGPMLERTHTELLDPFIDLTFNKLQRAGVLPPAPDEIQGQDLNVEYVSVLAQAQRLVSIGSLDRLGNYVGQLSQVWPEARHKFNAKQAVDEYADALGTTPSVVRSDDEVEALEKIEAESRAQEEAMLQGQQLAETAKTASQADLSGENALSTTMRNAGLA